MLRSMQVSLIIIAGLMMLTSQAAPMENRWDIESGSSSHPEEATRMSEAEEKKIINDLLAKYPRAIPWGDAIDPEHACSYWTERGEKIHGDKFYYHSKWPEPYRSRHERMWNKKKNPTLLGKLFRRPMKHSAEPVDYEELIEGRGEDEEMQDYHGNVSESIAIDRTRKGRKQKQAKEGIDTVTEQLSKLQLEHAQRLLRDGFGNPEPGWQIWMQNNNVLDEVYSTCYMLLESSGYDFDTAKNLIDEYGNIPVAQTILLKDYDIQWSAINHLLNLQAVKSQQTPYYQ